MLHAMETPHRPVHVRPAGPADRSALLAFVGRCSPETLYRRFHGATGTPLRRELEHILGSGPPTPGPSAAPRHRSWIAVDGDAVRGTATLAWGRDGTPEAGFLVEDAWFRRGVGRALFAALEAEARCAGATRVLAWVQGDNTRAVRFLRGVAPGAATRFDRGEIEVVIPVAAAVTPLPVPAAAAPADPCWEAA